MSKEQEQADREAVAKALFGVFGINIPERWKDLDDKFKESWRKDADRILSLLKPELLSKEMVAWIVKRLSSKDGAEFMVALSTGKPLTAELDGTIIHVNYDKRETTIYAKGNIAKY